MSSTQKDASPTANEWLDDTENRRHGTRIPCQNAGAVSFSSAGQDSHGAVLDDISFAGVALRVTSVSGLAEGQGVDIVILNRTMPAVIKYIAELEEGGYRVGLEFVDADRHELSAAMKDIILAW
jgi:hypothetical protein